jgi:hypothetical protein
MGGSLKLIRCLKGFMKIRVVFRLNKFPITRISEGFNSNNGVTYGWSPKEVNLTRVELRKFHGVEVFTCEKEIEKYFEMHNIMDYKQRIHITTFNLEIKPY